MAPPQERDYIGLSPAAAAAATELRLGLPGTEDAAGDGGGAASEAPLTLELLSKGGAKRGFTGAVAEEEDEKKKAQPPAAKAQVVGWPPIRSYRKNTMATNLSAPKSKEEAEAKQAPVPGCLYVKVSMDGAPYLRKVDLKMYKNYKDLSLELEKKFSGFTVGLHNMVCADCGLRNTIDFACEVCRNEFTWALLAYRVFLIPAGHGESTGKSGRDGLSDCRLMDLKSGTELVLTYEDKDGDWMLVGDVPWRMFTDSCRRMRIMKGSDAVGLAPRAIEKSKNQK